MAELGEALKRVPPNPDNYMTGAVPDHPRVGTLTPAALDGFIAQLTKADVSGPKGVPDGVLQSKEQVDMFVKMYREAIEKGDLTAQFQKFGITPQQVIDKLDAIKGDPKLLADIASKGLDQALPLVAAMAGREGSLKAKLETVRNAAGGTGITFDTLDPKDIGSGLEAITEALKAQLRKAAPLDTKRGVVL